jgi:integrase
LEQGQANRGETSAAPKARLVNQDSIAVTGARIRDLALFNLAIDSKLRGCDVVAIKVEDIARNGYTMDRATVRQKKTDRPVKFELTDQTRHAVDDYLKAAGKSPGEFLFSGRRGFGQCMTTRQYARLLSEWIASIGLDPNSLARIRCGEQRQR